MRIWWTYAITALVVFFVLRLPFFSQVPIGLNRDEAALGYNAYSILHSGRDEYGTWFPVSITSFGDQKLPAYVYTLIPFVGMFGLHPWVVRLPSLLAGAVIVLLLGKLAEYLAPQVMKNKKLQQVFPLVAMLSVALSPWSNHFSRVAYEAHEGMMFFLAGLLMYIKSRDLHSLKPHVAWTSLFWSLALLSYHSYHILVPLTVVALFIIDFSLIKKTPVKNFTIAVAIGLSVLSMMAIGGVWSGNTKKSQGISPFHAESLWRSVTLYRAASPWLGILNKVAFNPTTEAMYRFTSNYASTLSGAFYFVRGAAHPDHNPGGVPNFHLYAFIFVLIGLGTLWEKRSTFDGKAFMSILAIGLAVPSFTIHPEHTVRLSPVFPFIDLIASIGIITLFESLHSMKVKKIVLAILLALVLWSVTRYMTQYLFLAQTSEVSHEKHHLLSRAVIQYKTDSNEVITQSPSSSPYIWYLFETSMKPQTFWSTVERYPEDSEHFRHVKRVGNLTIESIQWPDLYARAMNRELILIFEPRETPGEVRSSDKLQLIDALKDSFGTTQYEVWKVK